MGKLRAEPENAAFSLYVVCARPNLQQVTVTGSRIYRQVRPLATFSAADALEKKFGAKQNSISRLNALRTTVVLPDTRVETSTNLSYSSIVYLEQPRVRRMHYCCREGGKFLRLNTPKPAVSFPALPFFRSSPDRFLYILVPTQRCQRCFLPFRTGASAERVAADRPTGPAASADPPTAAAERTMAGLQRQSVGIGICAQVSAQRKCSVRYAAQAGAILDLAQK